MPRPVGSPTPVVAPTGSPATRTDDGPGPGDVPGRVGAFFDVDNTIIRGASAFHLAVGLYRRGFFRRRDILGLGWQEARYLALGENREQIEQIRSRALSIMRGHSVAEMTAIAESVYDEVLALRIYPGTRALLDAHLAAGHQVWLVTASPVEIGRLIATRLGATGAVGTVAEHRDGFYTGRLVGDLLHGQAKVRAVLEIAEREGIDLTTSYAYGDSVHDVGILSTVGHPSAINPDPRLRRHARRAGWPVQDFRGHRRTVRRGTTASLAGLAWVVTLAVRGVRQRRR